MRTALQITSGVIAFLSLFTHIKFPTFLAGRLMRQPGRSLFKRLIDNFLLIFIMPIMPIKIIIGIFPLYFAILSVLGFIAGIFLRDPFTILSSLIGAVLLIRNLILITRPVTGFEKVFALKKIPRTKAPLLYKSKIKKDFSIELEDGKTLLCDIWEPDAAVPPNGLGIIHLHATAWQGMDKGQLVKPLFTRLTSHGYTVFDLAYSLAPQADLPQMVSELKQTIVWVKQHAKEYQLESEKIVLMGESGGGHLALLAAYTPNDQRFQPPSPQTDTSVCGVIAIHAPTDLKLATIEYGKMEPTQPKYSHQITATMQPNIHDKTPLDRMVTAMKLLPAYRYKNSPGGDLLMVNLLGGTLEEIPEKYDLYSPIQHVSPDSPLTLYLTGADDYYYQEPYGEILHNALLSVGAPSIYHQFPETDHGFLLFGTQLSPAAQVSIRAIEKFLAQLI